MIHEQTKAYEWDGSEYDHLEKSVDWYWGLGIVVVTISVIAIISGNYLLAVLLILGGIMLGFYANDKPIPAHIELSERGIKINADLFIYASIKSFWVYKDHRNRDRLVIVTGGKILPIRVVTLSPDIPATDVRNYLLNFLAEKETKPSMIDLIAETVGL